MEGISRVQQSVRPMSKCRYLGSGFRVCLSVPEFGLFPCRYIWHSFLLCDDSGMISHHSVFTCSGLTKCAYFTEVF